MTAYRFPPDESDELDVEMILQFLSQVLPNYGESFNDLERKVFRGMWVGQTYRKIYQSCKDDITYDYLERHVGPQLLKKLRRFNATISKRNLKDPVRWAYEKWRLETQPSQDGATEAVDAPGATVPGRSPDRSTPPHTTPAPSQPSPAQPSAPSSPQERRTQLLGLPDALVCHGREDLVEELAEAIHLGDCRLLLLYGLWGIGKTSLALELTHEVESDFQFVYWHRIEPDITLEELLGQLIRFFSWDVDEHRDPRTLLEYFTRFRCLVILDGLERLAENSPVSLLDPYAQWLAQLAQSNHQSCLLVTTRELPRELKFLDGARNLAVPGLSTIASQTLLGERSLSPPPHLCRQLARECDGNPWVLGIAGSYIQQWFRGDIERFLDRSSIARLPGIKESLEALFNDLSEHEQAIVTWLTDQGGQTTVELMMEWLDNHPIDSDLSSLEVLDTLERKGLRLQGQSNFALPRLLRQYVLLRNQA